jgi:hypothetical protein
MNEFLTEAVALPTRLGWYDINGELGWVPNVHRLTASEAEEQADVHDFIEDAECEISWISKLHREVGDQKSQLAYLAIQEIKSNPTYSPAMAYTVAYQKLTIDGSPI